MSAESTSISLKLIVDAVKFVICAESACKSLNLAESPVNASMCAESIVVLLE